MRAWRWGVRFESHAARPPPSPPVCPHSIHSTALFHLEEYEAAAAAFARVLAAEPGNADATVWARKCAAELEEEQASGAAAPAATTAAADDADAAAVPPPPPAPTAPTALPVQWFQTADKVEVAVLAKRLTADRVRVEISDGRLVVEVRPAAGGGGSPGPPGALPAPLDLALAHPVDASKSGWELLPTKIEVRLAKEAPGVWNALGAGGAFPAPGLPAGGVGGGGGAPAGPPSPPHPAAQKETSPPRGTYPSSSAKPKDWAALEKAVAAEEADTPPEGEAALTHLFRTLYADADDDTRRAMVKSYQESGGTVLSTNWAEVGKEEVKMTAPEGMEVKKFEY